MTDFETLAGHLLSLAQAVREKKGLGYAGKTWQQTSALRFCPVFFPACHLQ